MLFAISEPFYDLLSHALMCWQLISHDFSKQNLELLGSFPSLIDLIDSYKQLQKG